MTSTNGEREPLLGTTQRTSPGGRVSPPKTSVVERHRRAKLSSTEAAKKVIKDQLSSCCSVEAVKGKFPITKWLPRYNLRDLQCDFIAGLTVGLTVIPQGLAYAKIANLPPQYGLYSAFMGCFVYCFLGTSKDITLGPTAIMSLMTATFAVSPVKDDPTYAILLCLMTGIVQFLMGVLHLGILVNFISYPVINAFTSAAAITIAFGQVKGILGLKNIPRDFPNAVYETFKHIGETRIPDMILGLVCLVILFVLKKIRQIKWKDEENSDPTACTKIARYIVWLSGTAANAIVVISAAGVAAAFISEGKNDTLTITGNLKSGVPPFKPPDFSLHDGNTTYTAGNILSSMGSGLGIVPLLGLVELIAIGKAFARQNNYKIKPSQELIAIGVANIISSFVSSYPVTGSFSRTAVNSQSGVRTPASGIFTGALILLALYVLTPLFYYIPKAALSAVIISAVIQMVDYKIVMTLWRVNKIDLLPHVVTFVASLAIGIEYGILIGIALSLIILLYPIARPDIQVDNIGVTVVKPEHGLLFPAIEYVQERVLKENEADGRSNSVVIDCSQVTAVDYTTIQGIMDLILDFERRKAKLVFASLPAKVLHHLQDADIPHLMVSFSVQDGCKLIQEELKSEFSNDSIDGSASGELNITVTNVNDKL
ncbi:hypothetical protein FSP39_019726 [Pinctada imbricata]|uniref:STAS domain-containing protein n=1 Tax=Pinctada imbricata TaxID=66713 RepID=A0AA88XS96_PINIB|nr:hypothetical protein FSP39_019726 [Pinctada imbricata]